MNKNQIVKLVKSKTVNLAGEILKCGGQWLGSARNWIQWNCINGSDVTWGSHDYLKMNRSLTVSDIEQFAARIAAATLEDFARHLSTDAEKIALRAYVDKNNWASYIEPSKVGNLVVFQPDTEKLHYRATFSHVHGFDLVEKIDD